MPNTYTQLMCYSVAQFQSQIFGCVILFLHGSPQLPEATQMAVFVANLTALNCNKKLIFQSPVFIFVYCSQYKSAFDTTCGKIQA